MRSFVAWAGTLVVLAACGADPGVYVTVQTGGLPADHVVLYLGAQDCQDAGGNPCMQIAPPVTAQMSRPLDVGDGGAWFRDDNVQLSQQVMGNSAQFRIVASDSQQTLQIVAVGFSGTTPVGTSVIRDVTVPHHQAVQIDTTLVPAKAVTDAEEQQQTDGDFVLVWSSAPPRMPSPSDCVVAEHRAGGSVSRVFVVPSEDADCDGNLTFDGSGQRNPLECNELWFDFKGDVAPFSDSNQAMISIVNGHTSCVLAGPTCADGLGPSSQAVAPVAPTTCMAQGICPPAECGMPGGRLSGCVATLPAEYVTCTVYADAATGAPCPTAAGFAPQAGRLELDKLFPGSACKDIAFSTMDSLANIMPQQQLQLPQPGTAVFDVQNRQDACNFDLTWNDGVAPPDVTGTVSTVLALLRTQSDRGILVPVTFQFHDCAAAVADMSPYGIVCTAPDTPLGSSTLNCL